MPEMREELFVKTLLAAIGLPAIEIFYSDYGQEIVFEIRGGRGVFVRAQSRRASLCDAPRIRDYLLTPRQGRQTRAEVMQFLGNA